MRNPVFLSCLLAGLCALANLQAQNPGAAQDAEAAREKLLKAADTLDNIQANSESTRGAVDGMKGDVTSLQQTVAKLQTDNAALRQQLTDLQASVDQYKADQAKSRQALIDNVAAMIAAGSAKSTHPKKDAAPTETPTAPPKPTTTASTAPSLAPPAEDKPATPPPAPKPQKGYYHVVATGETVPMIAEAYRDSGVKITASQIRKANGLTPESKLQVGQKLFIPRPGT